MKNNSGPLFLNKIKPTNHLVLKLFLAFISFFIVIFAFSLGTPWVKFQNITVQDLGEWAFILLFIILVYIILLIRMFIPWKRRR